MDITALFNDAASEYETLTAHESKFINKETKNAEYVLCIRVEDSVLYFSVEEE